MSIVYVSSVKIPSLKKEPVSMSQAWASYFNGSMQVFIIETEWASSSIQSAVTLFLQHGIKCIIIDRFLNRTLKFEACYDLKHRVVKPTMKNIKSLLGNQEDCANLLSKVREAKRLLEKGSHIPTTTITVEAPLTYIKRDLKDWVRNNVAAHQEEADARALRDMATLMWEEIGDPTDEDFSVLRGYVNAYNTLQLDAEDLRQYDWRRSPSNHTELVATYEEVTTISCDDLANTFARLYELDYPRTDSERNVTIQQGWAYIKYNVPPTVLIDKQIETNGIRIVLPTPIG